MNDLHTFPYKMQERYEHTAVHEDTRLARCHNILDQMRDSQQAVNHQNDRVWGTSDSIEGRRVNRRQYPLSVPVWAAVSATGMFHSVLRPSTPSGTLAIYWKRNCCRIGM